MKKEKDMLEDKGKLKTNNKKKKIIVTTVTTAVVFITVGTGVYINNLIKVKNYLSDLTYDIVQESYDTYGDYSKSKYQDIVPENIYSSMNYLCSGSYDNRDEFIIYVSNQSKVNTLIFFLDTAESKYTYEIKFSIKGEEGYSYGKSTCTVQWKLDDDNVWRVSDFDDPP